MTTWEVIKAPGVPIVLFVYGHVMLLGLAYTAGTHLSPLLPNLTNNLEVTPVFFFTPAELGGFGFTPAQISLFMAAVGVSQAIWLLVFFPPLQAKYGTVSVLKTCLAVWPFLFMCFPMCNTLLRNGYTTAFVSAYSLSLYHSCNSVLLLFERGEHPLASKFEG